MKKKSPRREKNQITETDSDRSAGGAGRGGGEQSLI